VWCGYVVLGVRAHPHLTDVRGPAQRDRRAVPSVLIVDDRRAYAEALAFGLQQLGCRVYVGVPDRGQLDQTVDRVRPDAVVLDVDPPVDAVSLLGTIGGQRCSPRAVALTNGYDASLLAAVVRAGARAIVLKSQPVGHLAHVVAGVSADEMHIPPATLTRVMGALLVEPERNEWSALVDRLTERERDVLTLMAAGLRRTEIAARMFISMNTVRTHARNVLAKLEVHSSVEAVSVALKAGLRPPPP
jgi:DNA-binding NarL/FixJ family response regulator